MIAQISMITGCLIVGLLGLVHFIYVMSTYKFHAFDENVTQAMQQTSPVISKDTSMWKAWQGFNYSHSIGVLWIPLIYIPISLHHLHILQLSVWLTLLPALMALSYAILAKRYWFVIPFVGSLLALLCFIIAFFLLHL